MRRSRKPSGSQLAAAFLMGGSKDGEPPGAAGAVRENAPESAEAQVANRQRDGRAKHNTLRDDSALRAAQRRVDSAKAAFTQIAVGILRGSVTAAETNAALTELYLAREALQRLGGGR